SIQVLRQTMHGVEIILCDALEVAKVAESAKSSGNTESLASLQDDVDRRMQRRHIVTDLLFGRVTEGHPLYGWLTEHGFSKMDLKWFEQKATCVDVLGLDYYPHTEVELFLTPEGHSRQRVPEQHAGLYASALDYWERYRIPLMVTETSFTGSEKERRHWLEFTVQGVRQLRAAGVPVIGYTWWPLLDHLDWDGAMLHQVGHIHPVGIYALVRRENGRLDRVPTALRGDFQELIRKKETAIGGIANDLEKSGEAESGSQEEAEPRSQRVQAPTGFPIIVHCHLRWDGVWQRPQQFLSRLARSHRVLFVEGPIVVEGNIKPRYEIRAVPEHPNVTVMQTFFPQERFFKDGAWVDSERYRLLKEVLKGPLAGQFKRPIQWFYDPMAAPAFVGRMGEIAIVYDCMDELSQFKFAPPEIIEREKLLLSNADVVFAGGRKMWESKRRFNSNAHFYGCGVEVEHFAKARAENTEIPHDICFVMKPILGYFGVVDERLDYELIARMAEEHPEWSIVLVGPVVKIDPASLPRRPHLYWLGRRDYAQLPNYAKAFDVCLMPFALNEATEYINPTKALEYMATGRPIVSTAIADVVSNFSAAVQIARSHEEFIQKCAQSLAQPDRVAIERGLLLARDNQWESIVAKLEQHIEDVLNAKVFPRQFAEKRFALSTASAI
ncbi:MAG: glycosyltransferase, partial [Verrucomicrobiota bacterium]